MASVGAAPVGGPDAAHRVGHRGEALLLHLVERDGERLAAARDDLVRALHRHVAHAEQALDVHLADRRLAIDRLVHERLRVARLVALVVAVAPVAVHVDHHVLAEALAPLHGEVRDGGDGLRILAVHVEDGDVEHADDVGGVAGAPRLDDVGGEADLVVDDHVDRAARRVAGEPAQVQRLGDDALADERRVAVYEQRHHMAPRVGEAAQPVLLGAGAALDHGVDELEVARS